MILEKYDTVIRYLQLRIYVLVKRRKQMILNYILILDLIGSKTYNGCCGSFDEDFPFAKR